MIRTAAAGGRQIRPAWMMNDDALCRERVVPALPCVVPAVPCPRVITSTVPSLGRLIRTAAAECREIE